MSSLSNTKSSKPKLRRREKSKTKRELNAMPNSRREQSNRRQKRKKRQIKF